MESQAPILLRIKYALVHVPSRHKVASWAAECRKERDSGVPIETAGLIAAKRVFPYEAKGRIAPEGEAVATILLAISKTADF